MDNLKTDDRKVLINSIDYTTVGAYYDSVAAVNVLSFKKYGINIPYVAANFKGAKACSDNGALQLQEIELGTAAPCSLCDWSYGVTIVEKVRYPGVRNNQTNLHAKSYVGGPITITTTGGAIDDVWLLAAEDDIITQIYNDSIVNSDPVNGGGAIVDAVRSYKVTAPLAATNILAFTLTSTGVTTSIVLNTGATVITMCIDLNADVVFAAHARAIAISATEISIYGLTGADLFTIADGAGATTLVVDYRRIMFQAKSTKVQFAIQYDAGFATTYKRYIYALDGSASTASATAGKTIWIAGVAHNLPDLATTTLEVAAINAVTAAHFVYATNVGSVTDGNIYVNGTDAVNSLFIALSPSPGANPTVYIDPTYLTLISAATGTGSFPMLTGEDIYNELANQADGGGNPWAGGDVPDPTANYCEYFFQLDSKQLAVIGASHWDNYRGVVRVFIKSDLVDDHFLYPGVNAAAISAQLSSLNDAPAAAATMDFEQLLQAWAGTGTIAQATGIVTGGSNPNTWTN